MRYEGSDGTGLYYEDVGQGLPLILVHGAARSGRSFSNLMTELTEEYRVIVPDLRGLGRSDRVAPVHPRVWVEDLAALIEKLGVSSECVVFGSSLGSRVAGRMALEYPDMIGGLVVDSPMVGLSDHGNTALNAQYTAIEEGSAAALMYEELHGADWRDAVDFYFQSRNGLEFQSYLSFREELGRLTTPTLVCRGDFTEKVHPIDDAFAWYLGAPDAKLWIAPFANEAAVWRDQPDAFLGVLRIFVATLKGD